MLMRGQLTLFRVRGIKIGVDYSWFIVLFLVIIWLSGFYEDVLGLRHSDTDAYLLAVASALPFFASILLHELGHAVVASATGSRSPRITLWLFGGVARMEGDTDSPGTEFKVAIAGPARDPGDRRHLVAIGMAGRGTERVLDRDAGDRHHLRLAACLRCSPGSPSINLLVLVFNLIPAFPLDGGRVARAIAWRSHRRPQSGDELRRRGSARASPSCSSPIGLLILLAGNAISGIWLGAGRLHARPVGARRALQSEFSSRIEGITCRRRHGRRPVAIPEDASVARALDEYFLRYRWPWFPVVDAADRFLGLLVREAADAVPS